MRRAVVLLAFTLLAFPPAALAAFPGENGKIAFVRGNSAADIYAMNPDGSGQTPLTSGPALDKEPSWSPDGAKIAFTSNRDGGNYEIYVMNADGTAPTRLTNSVAEDKSPVWSPDGTKLVFQRHDGPQNTIISMSADGSGESPVVDVGSNTFAEPAWSPDGGKIAFVDAGGDISTVNPDGTGFTALCCASPGLVASPDWSPDGQQIVFAKDAPDFRIWKMNRDGSDSQMIPSGTDYSNYPAWSPDGTKIAFKKIYPNPPTGPPDIYVMNPDGGGAVNLTPGSTGEVFPDWQPILKGYPRPISATPDYNSLVVAYEPCSSPTKVHESALPGGSCTAQPTSDELTVGTADSNARPTKSAGFIRVGGLFGDPNVPGDEADVRFTASISDVRNRSDLLDYITELEGRISFRITDKSNSPYPGGQGPGTVAGDISYSFTIPCFPTDDNSVGSDCAIVTSADTLLPGSLVEGKRAIWESDQVEVYDGGADGAANTQGDNTLFMVQGVFAP